MMAIAEKILEIRLDGFINERELAEVGIGFVPADGEISFEKMLGKMVLKHIDTGMSVKQIVSIVEEFNTMEKHHTQRRKKILLYKCNGKDK